MKWFISIPLKLAFALAVCSIAAYVTFAYYSKGVTVELSDLSGRSVREAQLLLSDKGLLLNVGGDIYSKNIPAGFIVEQNITPGSSVKGETVVTVIVSKGPEVRLIPSVISMSEAEARAALREKMLDIRKVIHVHSDTVQEGVVLAQDPQPDQWAGEGITLIVSDGSLSSQFYAPSFLGMSKGDALLIASELGLSVEVREVGSGGIITRQTPLPGVEIKQGEPLQLRIGG